MVSNDMITFLEASTSYMRSTAAIEAAIASRVSLMITPNRSIKVDSLNSPGEIPEWDRKQCGRRTFDTPTPHQVRQQLYSNYSIVSLILGQILPGNTEVQRFLALDRRFLFELARGVFRDW
jgi:hypothetical protein